MDILAEIFSYFCGQGRCFVIDGSPLPVCQRCFGFYVGGVVTAIWLLLSGIWRRGLPSRGILLVDAVVLLTAILGGLHIIDPGPKWRLTCGLWTGHIFVLWLGTAAGNLHCLSKQQEKAKLCWRPKNKVQALLVILLMPLLAVAWCWLAFLGWPFWTSVAGVGLLKLLIVTLLAIICASRFIMARVGSRSLHQSGA